MYWLFRVPRLLPGRGQEVAEVKSTNEVEDSLVLNFLGILIQTYVFIVYLEKVLRSC